MRCPSPSQPSTRRGSQHRALPPLVDTSAVEGPGALIVIGLLTRPAVAWAAPGSNPSAERAKVRAARQGRRRRQRAQGHRRPGRPRPQGPQRQRERPAGALARPSGRRARPSRPRPPPRPRWPPSRREIDQLKLQHPQVRRARRSSTRPVTTRSPRWTRATPARQPRSAPCSSCRTRTTPTSSTSSRAAEQDLDVERKLAHRRRGPRQGQEGRRGRQARPRSSRRATRRPKFADQVQYRLDQDPGEAASLAPLDASLSRQIEQEELARAHAGRKRHRRPEAAARSATSTSARPAAPAAVASPWPRRSPATSSRCSTPRRPTA